MIEMKFSKTILSRYWWLPVLFLGFSACQEEATETGKEVQEIQTDGKISSIIRNPVTLDGPSDTVNVAKMNFEETIYDFGEVDEGAVVKHVFEFTNTGKVPLVINNAHSTCGCTIPHWPKEAVDPGQSAKISVEFDTKAKSDFQEKPVIITANTYPNTTKVYLKGFVRRKQEE
jgi:hypothetical protein